MMKRIVWAIDPFESNSANLRAAKETLRSMLSSHAITILPVTVFTPPRDLAESNPALVSLSEEREATRRALRFVLHDLHLPGLADPEIVETEVGPLSDPALALLQHAKRQNADAIVVGTQGRHGLVRWVLGSFAENLILHSDLPVLVIGPKAAAPHAPGGRLLFPTDASPQAERVFERVLSIAKEFGMSLVISHVRKAGAPVVAQSAAMLLGGGWIPGFAQSEQEETALEERARAWVERARAHGVDAELSLNDRGIDVSKAILEEAHALHPSAIAIATYSGALEAAVLGSVARDVMRQAEEPAWVIRSRQ